jgi:ethanolamine utilization protein EutN
MLAQIWTAKSIISGKNHGSTIVVYDELGAGPGQTIAVSEGAEASKPFSTSMPLDAYCSALIDEVFYQETESAA